MLRAPNLQARTTRGASVEDLPSGGWRLALPSGVAGEYRLSQLDDYAGLPRAVLPWQPPLRFQVRARASSDDLKGTWGFGLWNDPFGVGLGLGGGSFRLPVPPNAAWFFHASPPNYLSLRDDQPGHGFLAGVFASSSYALPLFALALPLAPLLAWPQAARVLRGLAGRVVRDDAMALSCDVTLWHDYALEWHASGVRFYLDGESCFTTDVAPRGPLGLVLWIDNQYAAFAPDGRIRYGALATGERAWLELAALEIDAG